MSDQDASRSHVDLCVVGLGYIGLPLAIVAAKSGLTVHGVDTNPERITQIYSGTGALVESDLQMSLDDLIPTGRQVTFGSNPAPANTFVICVPTPTLSGQHAKVPDLQYVDAAINSLKPVLGEGSTIIVESTCPVGTVDSRYKQLKAELEMEQLFMASCPERILPGNTMQELIDNDRIVGGVDVQSAQRAAQFYKHFVNGEIHQTSARMAEMAKLTENAYRDVNIAFANEVSMIADSANLNPLELIDLCNKHPRVAILQPGPGVGGHCIAVDPWFLIHEFPKESKLIAEARKQNIQKERFVTEKILEKIFRDNCQRYSEIVVFGATYKPNVPDLRESPALRVIQELSTSGVELALVEPTVDIETLGSVLPHIKKVSLSEVGASDDRLFVVLVDHDLFRDHKIWKLKSGDNFLDFTTLTYRAESAVYRGP